MFDDDLVARIDAWQARYRRWRNDYEAIIADAGAAVVVLPALCAREQARIRRCQVAVRSKHPDYDDVLLASGVFDEYQQGGELFVRVVAADNPAEAAYGEGERRLCAAEWAGVVLNPRHLTWLIRRQGAKARADLDAHVAEARRALGLDGRIEYEYLDGALARSVGLIPPIDLPCGRCGGSCGDTRHYRRGVRLCSRCAVQGEARR